MRIGGGLKRIPVPRGLALNPRYSQASHQASTMVSRIDSK